MAYFTYHEGEDLETSRLELHAASPEESARVRDAIINRISSIYTADILSPEERAELPNMLQRIREDEQHPMSVRDAVELGLGDLWLGSELVPYGYVIDDKYGLVIYPRDHRRVPFSPLAFELWEMEEHITEDVQNVGMKLMLHEPTLNSFSEQARPIERIDGLGRKVLSLEEHLSVGTYDNESKVYTPFATILNNTHPARAQESDSISR